MSINLNQKFEIYQDLQAICNDILYKIIGPTLFITIQETDMWLADIETFALDDSKKREAILTKIEERYQLDENDLNYVDSYTPLIDIALYIYLKPRKEANQNGS